MDRKKFINMMRQYNISADELLYLELLTALEDGDDVELELETFANVVDVEALENNLIDEKYMTKGHKPTKLFDRSYRKATNDLGKELYDAYPEFGDVDGKHVWIKGVSRKFGSLDEAFAEYARAIGNNAQIHKEILDLVNWGASNNLINCTLAAFIIDRRWDELIARRAGKTGNINYDAVTMI